jgi:hypothetical protein
MDYTVVGVASSVNAEQRLTRLRWLHGLAAVIHLISAAVTAGLAKHFFVPVYILTQTYGAPTYAIKTLEHEFPVHWTPALFLFLACLDHLIVACTWTVAYKQRVARGQGYACWIEYTASAAVMNVGIAALCGGVSALELLHVGCATAITMPFGAFAEWAASRDFVKTAWAMWATGFLPFAAAWSSIGVYYFQSGSDAPAFVTAILVAMLILESAFAVLLAWRIRQGMITLDNGAFQYEIGKIALSLSAKLTLAWIQFFGINSRA